MKSRISVLSCASLVLAGFLLLPGCGGEDAGLDPQFVVPRDTDAGAAQRPQVTLTVSNGAGVSDPAGNRILLHHRYKPYE